MRIKSNRWKISIKKTIREKQITIKKNKNTNQILRDKIKKKIKTKYITVKRLRTEFNITNK
jgi:hypothetical protein